MENYLLEVDKEAKSKALRELIAVIFDDRVLPADSERRKIRSDVLEIIKRLNGSDLASLFPGGELENLDLVGMRFSNCNLRNISFKGCFMIGASFDGAILDGANFDNTYLRLCKF